MSDRELESTIKAGAAQVDITPPLGTQLAGDCGRRRPAEIVLDPLYAKALVLESDGKKCCILALDLLSISKKYVDEIRQKASERFGIEPQATMVHAMHDISVDYARLTTDIPFDRAITEYLSKRKRLY